MRQPGQMATRRPRGGMSPTGLPHRGQLKTAFSKSFHPVSRRRPGPGIEEARVEVDVGLDIRVLLVHSRLTAQVLPDLTSHPGLAGRYVVQEQLGAKLLAGVGLLRLHEEQPDRKSVV